MDKWYVVSIIYGAIASLVINVMNDNIEKSLKKLHIHLEFYNGLYTISTRDKKILSEHLRYNKKYILASVIGFCIINFLFFKKIPTEYLNTSHYLFFLISFVYG